MATTVGATLISSKSAVAQGDLHPMSSPGDQPIVRCDQTACKEFLITEQIGPDEAKRDHPKVRTVSSLSVSAATSSSTSPAVPTKRKIPSPTDRSTRAPTRARVRRPTREMEIPGGFPCPHRRNRSAERHAYRRDAPMKRDRSPRSRHVETTKTIHRDTPALGQPLLVRTTFPSIAKGESHVTRRVSTGQRSRGRRPPELSNREDRSSSPLYQKRRLSSEVRVPREQCPSQSRVSILEAREVAATGSGRHGHPATDTPPRRSVFDRLSRVEKPKSKKRRRSTRKIVFTEEATPTMSVNAITCDQSQVSKEGGHNSPLYGTRQSQRHPGGAPPDDSGPTLMGNEVFGSSTKSERAAVMVTNIETETSGRPGHLRPTDATPMVPASVVDLAAAQPQTMHEQPKKQDQMAERHRSVSPALRQGGRQGSLTHEGYPPPPQARPYGDSLTCKEKRILIDTEQEKENLHTRGQRHQSLWQPGSSGAPGHRHYHSDCPTSPKKALTEKFEELRRSERLGQKGAAAIDQAEERETEVIKPYPPNWDSVPHPKGFNISELPLFDGSGLASQHLYHFKSLTGSIADDEPVTARLFINTLRGTACEWFEQLTPKSIKTWSDLEKSFLSRFPDGDARVSVFPLANAKQKEGELVKDFIKRYRHIAKRVKINLAQEDLVNLCRERLTYTIARRIGVGKMHTWADLQQAGERAEKQIP